MPMKRMPDSVEINLEHVDEAKAADKVSNSNHNKEASNGKKKATRKSMIPQKVKIVLTLTINVITVSTALYTVAPSTSVEVKVNR